MLEREERRIEEKSRITNPKQVYKLFALKTQ